MDSRKQSLFPKPSAAKQSFCCSLWIVAELWRTTSSSYRKRDRVTHYLICSIIISYFGSQLCWLWKKGGENKLRVKNSHVSSPNCSATVLLFRHACTHTHTRVKEVPWCRCSSSLETLHCAGIPGKMILVAESLEVKVQFSSAASSSSLTRAHFKFTHKTRLPEVQRTCSSMQCLWLMFSLYSCQSHAHSFLALSIALITLVFLLRHSLKTLQ